MGAGGRDGDGGRDEGGALSLGATDLGTVRFHIEQGDVEMTMDFTPDEAIEIAEELRAAAERARRGPRPAKRGA